MKRLNFVSLKSLQLQKVLLPPATSSIGLAGLAIPSPVDFLNTKPDVCSCTPVTDLVLALHATHLRAKCLHLHTELVTAPGRKAQKIQQRQDFIALSQALGSARVSLADCLVSCLILHFWRGLEPWSEKAKKVKPIVSRSHDLYCILYYIISIKICLSSIAVACCKWDPAGSGLRRDLATLPSDMWIWALWAGHCRPKSILWIQNSKCGSTYST